MVILENFIGSILSENVSLIVLRFHKLNDDFPIFLILLHKRSSDINMLCSITGCPVV